MSYPIIALSALRADFAWGDPAPAVFVSRDAHIVSLAGLIPLLTLPGHDDVIRGPYNTAIAEGYCPPSDDGQHCVHWWDDYGPCCRCGDDTIGGAGDDNPRELPEHEYIFRRRVARLRRLL